MTFRLQIEACNNQLHARGSGGDRWLTCRPNTVQRCLIPILSSSAVLPPKPVGVDGTTTGPGGHLPNPERGVTSRDSLSHPSSAHGLVGGASERDANSNSPNRGRLSAG